MEKLAVVKVFDFETGQERITLTGHRDYVKSVTYSPDGRRILTVSNDETAKLWDAESGRERLNFDLHSKYARAGFLLHGRCIVTSSWEDGTRFYDAATPEQVATWETDSQAQR